MERTPQQKLLILIESAQSEGLTGTKALLRIENVLHGVNEKALHNDGERQVYLGMLKEMDQQPGMEAFASNDRLKVAYQKLTDCDVETFWTTGYPKLVTLRETIWQEVETD